jgi:hypothetical protein
VFKIKVMKISNINLFSIIVLLAIAATGCLKDKEYDDGIIQSVHSTSPQPKVVELKISATSNDDFAAVAIDNSDNDTIVDFLPVNLATAEPAQEDIHVTVALDTNLVNTYDTTGDGADFGNPDNSMYTIVNPVVTIPKGSHTGYLQIKVKPSDFIGANWAFGFKIASIQEQGYTISGNFNQGVVALVIKNAYDGIYNAVGHFDHPSYAGDYNVNWTLVSVGTYANQFQLRTTVLFAVNITLTIDPATNLVTVSSSDVTLVPPDPSKNYYTPDDRTYHLDFSYSGGSRHLVGTATYTGPR